MNSNLSVMLYLDIDNPVTDDLCMGTSRYCFYLQVRDLVPESQAYMDLLAFERKLDATITRKRLDIQEALKRPMKVLLVPIKYFP